MDSKKNKHESQKRRANRLEQMETNILEIVNRFLHEKCNNVMCVIARVQSPINY